MTRSPVLPPGRARLLRAGAVVAAGRLHPPVGNARRRAVCGAARLLTGLGVRVAVRVPTVAWPRTGRGTGLLLVANSVSPLDPLVLLTAVPGAVAAAPRHDRVAGVPYPRVPATTDCVADLLSRGTSVVVRPEQPAAGGAALGRFAPELFAAAVATRAPVCPVALRYRRDEETLPPAPGGRSLRSVLRWIGDAPGVVVEVHQLPALSPAGAAPAELATLAEYAVAGALGVGGLPGPAAPRLVSPR